MNIVLKDPNMLRAADLEPGRGFGFKVVAVIGQDNDWAAYRGALNWTDEQVVEEGDKLNPTQAYALFPEIDRLGLYYRS